DRAQDRARRRTRRVVRPKGRVNRLVTKSPTVEEYTKNTGRRGIAARTGSVVQRRAVARTRALPPTEAPDPPCGHGETDELHRVYPHQEVPRARIDRLRPCIPPDGLLQGLT